RLPTDLPLRARRHSTTDPHAQMLAMTSLFTLIGWTLMHVVWQACAIAVPVAILLRLCEHRSANTRYLIACAGLVAMLAAPLATARLLWPSMSDAAQLRGDRPIVTTG